VTAGLKQKSVFLGYFHWSWSFRRDSLLIGLSYIFLHFFKESFCLFRLEIQNFEDAEFPEDMEF